MAIDPSYQRYIDSDRANVEYWRGQLQTDPANTAEINKMIKQSESQLAKTEADALRSEANASTVREAMSPPAAQVEETPSTAPPSAAATPITPEEKAKIDEAATSTSEESPAPTQVTAEKTLVDPAKSAAEDSGKTTAAAPVSASNSTAAPAKDTKANGPTVPLPAPRENVLHNYATYTYGLTLYMLTLAEFDALQEADAEDGIPKWNPSHALISSAGKFSSKNMGKEVNRMPEFTEDFYFDNLKMTTVCGLNGRTRGTNAIDISFTIIEPYGLTLLNRLISASDSNTINGRSYLSQPYLLELDFYGCDDVGGQHAPIPSLKKRFPIQLIEFKIKASSKGAEYAVRAIPYSHNALKESMVTTPVNLEITANTVGEAFANFDPSAIALAIVAQKDEERQAADANSKWKAVGAANATADYGHEGRTQARVPDAKSIVPKRYGVTSYTDALNSWAVYLSKAGLCDEIDTYEFVIDPEIKTSPISAKDAAIQSMAMPDQSAAESVRLLSAGTNSATTDTAQLYKFNINLGTTIIDVINLVMKNSIYIKKQLVDSSKPDSFAENSIVNFYKIIPQVKNLRYDKKRGRYATTTVFHIQKYDYYNVKNPTLPYYQPTSSVKQYDYMYTGKNNDILDFNIEFNVAYFTSVSATPQNVDVANESNSSPDSANADPKVKPQPARKPGERSPVAPLTTEALKDVSGGGANNVNGMSLKAENAMQSIYSNSKGDMIEVKLKIVGDPDFIKQDDLYLNPGMKNISRSKLTTANGSIMYDYTDVFCKLSFKTPVDVDESTGLMRYDKAINSDFSGVYRILTVDSEFSRGQFTQTLTMVRMNENPARMAAANNERTSPTTTNAATDIRAIDNRIAAIDAAQTEPQESIQGALNGSAGGGRGFINPDLALPDVGITNGTQTMLRKIDDMNSIEIEFKDAKDEAAQLRRALAGGQ